MWPVYAAAAASAIDAGVSYLNADQNRDFSAKMSSTAHQREVKDLRAAGLNPILSAGGTGASTPGFSSFSSDFAGATTAGINSALAVKRNTAEIDLLQSQKKLADANALKTGKEADIIPTATPKTVTGDVITGAKSAWSGLRKAVQDAANGDYKPWWKTDSLYGRAYRDMKGRLIDSTNYRTLAPESGPSSARGYVPINFRSTAAPEYYGPRSRRSH